jgi:elongation factor Ts
MKITTEMVKELRDKTGAGVMEAKKALETFEGDIAKATESLREKGAARAANRADREASEGVIEVYAHPGGRMGVLVEVNCETDFVARNELFQKLAHDIALQVAAAQPLYVRPEDVPADEAERQGAQLQKFYEETVLLEQPFVRNESVKIKDMVLDAIRTTGENIVVRRFARFELGQSL